jgi:hypothetical protein
LLWPCELRTLKIVREKGVTRDLNTYETPSIIASGYKAKSLVILKDGQKQLVKIPKGKENTFSVFLQENNNKSKVNLTTRDDVLDIITSREVGDKSPLWQVESYEPEIFIGEGEEGCVDAKEFAEYLRKKDLNKEHRTLKIAACYSDVFAKKLYEELKGDYPNIVIYGYKKALVVCQGVNNGKLAGLEPPYTIKSNPNSDDSSTMINSEAVANLGVNQFNQIYAAKKHRVVVGEERLKNSFKDENLEEKLRKLSISETGKKSKQKEEEPAELVQSSTTTAQPKLKDKTGKSPDGSQADLGQSFATVVSDFGKMNLHNKQSTQQNLPAYEANRTRHSYFLRPRSGIEVYLRKYYGVECYLTLLHPPLAIIV